MFYNCSSQRNSRDANKCEDCKHRALESLQDKLRREMKLADGHPDFYPGCKVTYRLATLKFTS
jgi:hypothetical protein